MRLTGGSSDNLKAKKMIDFDKSAEEIAIEIMSKLFPFKIVPGIDFNRSAEEILAGIECCLLSKDEDAEESKLLNNLRIKMVDFLGDCYQINNAHELQYFLMKIDFADENETMFNGVLIREDYCTGVKHFSLLVIVKNAVTKNKTALYVDPLEDSEMPEEYGRKLANSGVAFYFSSEKVMEGDGDKHIYYAFYCAVTATILLQYSAELQNVETDIDCLYLDVCQPDLHIRDVQDIHDTLETFRFIGLRDYATTCFSHLTKFTKIFCTSD